MNTWELMNEGWMVIANLKILKYIKITDVEGFRN